MRSRPPLCCLNTGVVLDMLGLYGDYRVYWGCIGIMEKKMETTIMGYIGVI